MIPKKLFFSTATETTVDNFPTRSMDFEDTSAQFLSMEGSNFPVLNTKKFAFHSWVKVENSAFSQYYASKDGDGFTPIEFLNFLDKLDFRVRSTAGLTTRLQTSGAANISDTDWHQVVFQYDADNATTADRAILYKDQIRVDSFTVETYPAQGVPMNDSVSASVQLGAFDGLSNFDGLMFQVAWFDNTVVDINTLHSAGSPVDISTVSGCVSLLATNVPDALTKDIFVSANWTNNNGVVKSATVPT